MRPISERGALRPVSLRFVDDELEDRFQHDAAIDGLRRFRFNAATSCVLWLAAGLLPLATDLPPDVVVPATLGMALVSLLIGLLGRWATTLDRQHALAAILTVGNGLVLLYIASLAGVLPGYGVAAIALLWVWGSVLRARFVFGVARTIPIAFGFVVAAALSTGPSMVLDGFIFVAATIGSLASLHVFERTRRSLYHRDVVVREQADALEREKEKSDRLLLNVMPASISERLREGPGTIADEYPAVSILFADIVGFTALAARLTPAEVIGLLGGLYTRFDDLAAERGLEKIKTVGDTYMAAGGLPEALPDHASRIVDLGLAMIAAAARPDNGLQPVRLRIGVHSGPAVGGVIGTRKFAFDVWGDTVNVASRLESQGQPDRVHISQATWELVGDEFESEAQATVELRGRGPMTTHLVIRPRTPAGGR
ncbi:MAG TPA: adenylate/guanylate cyclase domain-containing protein [Candidatus Limnocylindria bacterium]